MKGGKRYLIGTALAVLLILAGVALVGFPSRKVDFTTQVKPILNRKCISCHGGVKKEGGFSLLFREEALAVSESGSPSIIPGKPEESEMIRRLITTDEADRMPYKHDALPQEEIDILTEWVRQGAHWGNHWSYVKIEPVDVPGKTSGWWSWFGKGNDQAENEVDYFIIDKLTELGLQPSPEASKPDLLRRVSLAITGLPPSPEIADRFLSSDDPRAYEELVDSLLASPAYGEKWASMWMDLARYADSKGYEKDSYRSIWRYRDWLIRAFNEDMPYDRFLTEQLAGDLLPGATDEQLSATAFHRNTMSNDEGGTDDEEFRTMAVIDRVNTTWETLMGTSFACVQCHGHTYDPFRHHEYYQFMAFFNNTRDADAVSEYPVLREYEPADEEILRNLTGWLEKNATREKKKEVVQFLRITGPSYYASEFDQLVNSAYELSAALVLRNNASARLRQVDMGEVSRMVMRYRSWDKEVRLNIYADSVGGPLLSSRLLKPSDAWVASGIPLELVNGSRDLYFSVVRPGLSPSDERSLVYIDWVYFTSDFPGKGIPGYDSAYQAFYHLLNEGRYTGTPVMVENPGGMSRTTRVFNRGNWLDKGDAVKPDVPGILNPFPVNAPRNRHGLAMWLTSKDNPLTSRTIANRVWEQLMGQGIAETLEDLGSQGILPTHRELLDWLSYQLMHEYDWSLKKLIRTIVLSATYRQTATASPQLLQQDPFNKYYARAPRVRLTAEQIRDQALAISGLLSRKMYGKSVMPYQPEGIWRYAYTSAKWQTSPGEDQYRRSLYTYWKRLAPYPMLLTFDGGSREVCISRRIRTNTPLQALTTLNDQAFIEMSRSLAKIMREDGGDLLEGQINAGYQRILFKPITEEKKKVFEKLYTDTRNEYVDKKEDAVLLAGDSTAADPAAAAALVVVANALLNLDETLAN